MSATIGFIGLGAMGGGVAINLVKTGFHVRGFDILKTLVDNLERAGGIAANSPTEVADGADFLCIMVANVAQTSLVLFARAEYFPTPMANTAEQLYIQGFRHNLLRDDDARLVTMYIPASFPSLIGDLIDSTGNPACSPQNLITSDVANDLLAGIHFAASVEAMAFCKVLGMDRQLMYTIISKAAGASEMFTRNIPGMLERDEWTLGAAQDTELVMSKLEAAVGLSKAMKYPCPMASAGLQQYLLGRLR